ncbi:MAG: hypothetical protein HY650_05615 [Acidobacteria bacterium]|nr:hypothetical protein [Acidobacteriota bacterium]
MTNDIFPVLSGGPSVDDAARALRAFLKEKSDLQRSSGQAESEFTLDLLGYLRDLIVSSNAEAISEVHSRVEGTRSFPNCAENTSPYVIAAWDLCRRGILAPAFTSNTDPTLNPAFSGWQFWLTPWGRTWLQHGGGEEVVPSEFDSFAAHLSRHRERFGEIYWTRSIEALRCYRAGIHMAGSTMCGAAGEAVVLHLATSKCGDKKKVDQTYRSAHGRKKIFDLITHDTNGDISKQMILFFGLLTYWRDDAAHAVAIQFDEETGFLALLTLLRFAQFAERRFDDIVRPKR